MELALNSEQRANMTICQLARYVFGKIKEGKEKPKEFIWQRGEVFHQNELLCALCRNSTSRGYDEDKNFSARFSEAISLLKRRGLLMGKIGFTYSPVHSLCLTSIGENYRLLGESGC